MAKVTYFIYCVNTEKKMENDSEMINANGVLAALTPEFIPGNFSFSILFSILDLDITSNNNVQIIFKKEGDDKKLVDTGKVILQPASVKDEIDLPKEYKGLNISMDMRNVILENEGLYGTDVYLNETMLGHFPIYVKGKRLHE